MVFSLLAFLSCVTKRVERQQTYVCYKSVIVNVLKPTQHHQYKESCDIWLYIHTTSDDVVIQVFVMKRNCVANERISLRSKKDIRSKHDFNGDISWTTFSLVEPFHSVVSLFDRPDARESKRVLIESEFAKLGPQAIQLQGQQGRGLCLVANDLPHSITPPPTL